MESVKLFFNFAEYSSYLRIRDRKEISRAFRSDCRHLHLPEVNFRYGVCRVEVKGILWKGIKVPSARHVSAIFLVLPSRYRETSRFPALFISFTGIRAIWIRPASLAEFFMPPCLSLANPTLYTRFPLSLLIDSFCKIL